MWRVTRKVIMEQRKKFTHVSSRPVPYTTKTGIQIGRFYEAPRQQLTPEGEFMQSVLLGIKDSAFPELDKIRMGTYAIAYIVVLFAIGAMVTR